MDCFSLSNKLEQHFCGNLLGVSEVSFWLKFKLKTNGVLHLEHSL